MASSTIRGLTVQIDGDTSKLGKALKDVEARSRKLGTELKDINGLLKFDPGNTTLLAQKQEVLGKAIEECAAKLDTLRKAEKQVQAQFERGEVSEEQYRALQREIEKTENVMRGYQKQLKGTTDALEKMGDGANEAEEGTRETGKEAKVAAKKVDDFSDAARDADKAGGNLGSTLMSVTKKGFTAVAATIGACITGLTAAAESTRDYRMEMGKLDAAYSASGLSSEAAANAYKKVVGVIGEYDQSVEAAQQIALLADSEKDVANWADLAAGVYGKFGDALQPETFYEAANETLKLGESTGAYTQMLEGCGMSVEDFNAGLGKCKTEQEKQAYMLSVTQKALGAAGEAYKKNNAEVIRANEANDKWMQSLSGVGGAIEPIITDIKMMGAAFVSDLIPGVQKFSEAFRGVLNGEKGSGAKLSEAFGGIMTGLLNKITSSLPTLVQTGASLVTSLVTSIVQQIPTLLTTGGQIVLQLLQGIAAQAPSIMQKAADMLTSFVNGVTTYLPIVLQKGSEVLMNLVSGISSKLPDLVNQALNAIQQFATTLAQNAPTLIQKGFEMLSKLIQGIVNCIPSLIAKVPTIISTFANIINDNFPTILAKGAQLLLQLIKGILSAIPTLIRNIPKIITAIVDVWEAFNWMQLGKKAIQLLGNGIKALWGFIKSAGSGVVKACTGAIQALPGKLLSLGKSAVSGLGNAIRNGWSLVKSGATTIFNGIVNYFKNLPSKMLSVGKDLIKGLWNGISDMAGWIFDKIQGFCGSVVDKVKGLFGIASPSKEFAAIGRDLDRGLVKGMLDNMAMPIKAAQRVASGVLGEMSSGFQLDQGIQQRGAQMANVQHSTVTEGMAGKLDKILSAIERGQVLMIDGKQFVGHTAGMYDNTLGQRRVLVARGAL